jgi:hypothetical protein
MYNLLENKMLAHSKQKDIPVIPYINFLSKMRTHVSIYKQHQINYVQLIDSSLTPTVNMI